MHGVRELLLTWPGDRDGLVAFQRELGRHEPPAWRPGSEPLVAGVFMCSGRSCCDAAWAGAAGVRGRRIECRSTVAGRPGAPYEAGLLALREGPLLEAAVRALGAEPDAIIVNATGRDHPRRAGLAVHLGAVLGIPTVGVTNRPLAASGDWPGEGRGLASPLLLEGEVVGAWVRTRAGARPVAVHPGWRTDVETAIHVVVDASAGARTPLPIREARRLARTARAVVEGLVGPGRKMGSADPGVR